MRISTDSKNLLYVIDLKKVEWYYTYYKRIPQNRKFIGIGTLWLYHSWLNTLTRVHTEILRNRFYIRRKSENHNSQ